MSESEIESDWSETSAVVESDADRIRRNDKSLEKCGIDWNSDAADILDALKHNTVVKTVTFYTACLVQLNREVLVKLFEAMKCNKSENNLRISIERGLLRERFFAAMATSGGWSFIQVLVLFYDETNIRLLWNLHSWTSCSWSRSFSVYSLSADDNLIVGRGRRGHE